MGNYYTLPIEAKVGNTREDKNGEEILITKIHNWQSFLDLEIINKQTGVQGTLRVNKPTDHTSSM